MLQICILISNQAMVYMSFLIALLRLMLHCILTYRIIDKNNYKSVHYLTGCDLSS